MQDPKFLVQSLHCYFISAPKNNLDVVYHVTRLKDGRTISTRGVTATQGKKTVFSCLVSLSVEEKGDLGLTHTDCPMPEVQFWHRAVLASIRHDSSGLHPPSVLASIGQFWPPSDMTKFADVFPNLPLNIPINEIKIIALNKSEALNVAK